jgi:hypothetical protein
LKISLSKEVVNKVKCDFASKGKAVSRHAVCQLIPLPGHTSAKLDS